MVEDDSGDERRSEGESQFQSVTKSDGGETVISNLGITGLSKRSYILSYIVTGHPCDRVTECSIRFYLM